MTRAWPKDAPDPHDHPYRLWTADSDEMAAVASFKDRYGKPPEWVIEHLGHLWIGPIPEEEQA